MPTYARATDRQVEETLSFIDELVGGVEPRDFAFRLWDGTGWGPGHGSEPRFTIVLKHPGSLRRMFLPPSDLTIGEAYIYDDFDVEGDIEAIATLGDRLQVLENEPAALARHGVRLLKLPSGGPSRAGGRGARLRGRAHSKQRDEAATRYHYDVSNDFYSLWLDRNMVYSCAYFHDTDEDLDTAQERKLDYICRKLRLKPGERLLDIGCGWGGLVLHAAREYGADALGITLSPLQATFARERIAEEGMKDRCRVAVLDYRDVDEAHPFDKLVSVGMFEHVGKALLPTYFEKAARLLRPGGVFLNHGISTSIGNKPSLGPSFSDVYVFPDGELLPISTMLAEAEKAGFEVRDVESLREHYAMTLRRWVRRLERNADAARAVTDEVTYRIWRLFMSYSAHQFSSNAIGVYQTVLVRPNQGKSGLPLTRQEWYT